MPRVPTGHIRQRNNDDGTITYVARFSFGGRRRDVVVGKTPDWSHARASAYLRDVIMPAVRQGTWEPPTVFRRDAYDRGPTVHELATDWYFAKAGEGFTRQVGLRLIAGTATRDEQSRFDSALWGSPSTAIDQGRRLRHVLREVGDRYVVDLTVDDVLAMRKRLADWRLYDHSDVARRDVAVADRKRTDRALSSDGIDKIVRTLRSIMDWGMAKGVIVRNPVTNSMILTQRSSRQRTKASRQSFLHNIVSYDDWAGLIETCRVLESSGQKHSQNIGRTAAFGLLWLAGLRNQEACALRWVDVDLDRRLISVRDGKSTSSIRQVLIVDGLVPILKEWRQNTRFPAGDDLVIPTATGRRRDRQSLRNRIVVPVVDAWNAKRQETAMAAGSSPPEPLRLTPHDGRRSMCTWWAWTAESGEGARSLMDQVGHRDARLALEVYALNVDRDIIFDERFIDLMRRPRGRRRKNGS